MFQKLRKKFLLLSTSILLGVILVVTLTIYILSSQTIMAQTEVLTSLILDNGGTLPYERHFSSYQEALIGFSPELLYETRYFSVTLNEEGEATAFNITQVATVSMEAAASYAEIVYYNHRSSGRLVLGESDAIYYYEKRTQSDGSTLIVFTDSTTRYRLIQYILFYMSCLWFVILVLYVLLMGHYSKKLILPFVENDEKQKRFITNASHELKTPLAVISANTEMTEALGGKNKWTESTKRQLANLQKLIEELVVLTRLEEMEEIDMKDVNFSDIVKTTVEPFFSVIESSGKTYQCTIPENIHVNGDTRGLQQITSILMDNAVKYCDEGGTITVRLAKKTLSKGARLTVSNTYAEGRGIDYDRFFERFYRQDESHNSKKAGFGIGLSMGREIMTRMKGHLKVSYAGDTITFSADI